METPRLVLLISLTVVGLILMQKWQEDYPLTEPKLIENNIQIESKQSSPPSTIDLPDVPIINQNQVFEGVEVTETKDYGQVIVETDVYQIKIGLKGASIEQAKFKQYPVDVDKPEEPLVFLDNNSDLFYVLQGGLFSKSNSPTEESIFTTKQTDFRLLENEKVLEVPLYWQSETGLLVEKIYRFQRDRYLVEIEYRIQNNSAETWQGRAYGQIQRSDPNEGRGLIYTYTGAVLSTPDKRYEKIDFDDIEEAPLVQEVTNGWVAMIQHYFVSAIIPDREEEPYYYYTKANTELSRYTIGAMTPVAVIASGESKVLKYKTYVGPKIQSKLQELAPKLELTVDYGVLWFIAKPLFTCLDWLHSLTHNWGWSIILVTMLLKLIFYPLSAAGYRSMANMRRVQPRLMSMRERYKNDKARLNQAMMALYKEEKINPLGGCFPILIQIPVFIALYWVLLESVEMRQAPFMLWWQDLSSPDPWFVLPVIMGITMFIQQKLNPAPMDPVQQKVMSFLPFFFTIFFAFFPSGLVLYWVVNNTLSIVQQARINHNLEKAGLK